MAKTGSSVKNPNKGIAGGAEQILPDARRRMIAELAYFRAAQRGFNGGDPVDDWLVAEKEINHRLSTRHQQK